MPNPPIAWRPDRTATGDPRVRPLVWMPCVMCWGQGRIYAKRLDADGRRPWWACDRCLGLGLVPA